MRWVCDIREALQPFHLNDSISFDITNYLQLVDSLSKEDYKLFMSDIRHIVKCFKTGRLDYGVKVWLCMRKYKLKEDVSEAGQAKARRWLKM
ncbi:hypothetical protein HDE_00758 [Halotydeus destructor]|nr:hypothetical protein HDE_00758 [Halotydeus destructor]